MTKTERLKRKIKLFNAIMLNLSEDFTAIFHEGKEREFHDELLEMLRSLDSAQQIIRNAYNLFLTKKISEN